MCNLLCMYGYICAGYLLCWIYMCWLLWYICCDIFPVIIVGYKKNRIKEAVQALCRPPRMAKTPLPSVADGKGGTWRPPVLPERWAIWQICLPWRTAKLSWWQRLCLCRPPRQTAKNSGRWCIADVNWRTAKRRSNLPSAGGRQRPPLAA